MTVAGEAELRATFKLGRMRAHESLAEAGGDVQMPRGRRPDVLELLHVALPPREHPIRVPIRHHIGRAMERCQQPSRRRYVRRGERARGD